MSDAEVGLHPAAPQHAALGGDFGRPPPRPAEVLRTELLDLRHDPDVRVVLISAPAGFGKSILAGQWCSADPARPFLWIALSAADNDPVVLLTRLLAGLERVAPIPTGLAAKMVRHAAGADDLSVPELALLMAERRPLLIAFDDTHLVTSASSLALLRTVAAQTGPTAQTLFAGRSDPDIGIARLRATRTLLEIRASGLQMDLATATLMLAAAGPPATQLGPDVVAEVHRVTEGWPAGIALAALSSATEHLDADVPVELSGRRSEIGSYFFEEVLSQQSDETRDFLLRTSGLSRFCAGLCDSMLERSGSGAAIRHLARTNLFVIPLDGNGTWFRYHHLFQDLLADELERTDPTAQRGLHCRAAAWHHSNGTVEEGLDYAQAGGDVALAGRLVLGHWEDFAGRGQLESLRLWLLRSTDAQIESDPSLAIGAGWVFSLLGDMERAERYVAAAASHPLDVPSADGATSLRSSLANLRSGLGSSGATAMLADGKFVDGSERPTRTRWLLGGCRASGTAQLILGRTDESIAAFEEALLLTGNRDAVAHVRVFCLGYLALACLDRSRGTDRARAASLVDEAESIVAAVGLNRTLQNIPTWTARAALSAAANDVKSTVAELANVSDLLSLTTAAPWMTADISLRCAESALTVGARADAVRLAGLTRRALARLPDGGVAPERLARLESLLVQANPVFDRLTPAQRRVLEELPTHWSVGEIADRLYVSRSTVKTHIARIYATLGVSSRAEAVAVLHASRTDR